MNAQNIDPQEIAKFDKFAHDWWNPLGKMKPLHQLNPVRLNYIQGYTTLINKYTLDVGCGGGILSESLAKQGAKVTAIDLSAAALAAAKQHATTSNLAIDYQLIQVEALAEQGSQQFDLITCMEMLEHVPDPALIIKACSELLKPGGYAFFSTIHRNPKAYMHAILGAEYLLNLLPKGTHDYAKFIRPSELDSMAAKVSLSLIDLTGIHYSPLQQRFSLSPDVSVNYLCTYQKQTQSHVST